MGQVASASRREGRRGGFTKRCAAARWAGWLPPAPALPHAAALPALPTLPTLPRCIASAESAAPLTSPMIVREYMMTVNTTMEAWLKEEGWGGVRARVTAHQGRRAPACEAAAWRSCRSVTRRRRRCCVRCRGLTMRNQTLGKAAKRPYASQMLAKMTGRGRGEGAGWLRAFGGGALGAAGAGCAHCQKCGCLRTWLLRFGEAGQPCMCVEKPLTRQHRHVGDDECAHVRHPPVCGKGRGFKTGRAGVRGQLRDGGSGGAPTADPLRRVLQTRGAYVCPVLLPPRFAHIGIAMTPSSRNRMLYLGLPPRTLPFSWGSRSASTGSASISVRTAWRRGGVRTFAAVLQLRTHAAASRARSCTSCTPLRAAPAARAQPLPLAAVAPLPLRWPHQLGRHAEPAGEGVVAP